MFDTGLSLAWVVGLKNVTFYKLVLYMIANQYGGTVFINSTFLENDEFYLKTL